MGRPTYPSPSQLTQLRDAAELAPIRVQLLPVTKPLSTLSVNASMSGPSLHLTHVCAAALAEAPPPAPTRLALFPTAATTLTRPEVVLRWETSAGTRRRQATSAGWRMPPSSTTSACVRTFEVQHRLNVGGETDWVRVSERDFVFEAYTHSQPAAAVSSAPVGCYRVRAIDYWGQAGPFAQACV
jgi:hypothetical protein